MSVRKRTWTTAKGEAKQTWIVAYTDQAGKRRLKTFDRKKDADAYSATARVEVREGTHTADSESVSVAIAGRLWIATAEKNRLERSTVAAYQQHLGFHIVPAIGALKLSQLTAPLIREFEDKLGTGPDARSAAMRRKIMGSLGALIADAQERGLVARNVVRDLRGRRRPGKDRRAEKRQKGRLKIGVDIPAPIEIKAFVGALTGRWRPVLLTAVFTGLRASELRGLHWPDVDLKRAEVHVRQRADRYNAIGAPKSGAGDRAVPLPPIVVATLREWKIACPPGGLVFPNGHGKVESLANIINRGLVPSMVAAGVATKGENAKGEPVMVAKYTGMHALRHFYASWSINRRTDGGLELPPKIVQERLGHSSITMTMDVYGHLFPRGDDAAELAAAQDALLN